MIAQYLYLVEAVFQVTMIIMIGLYFIFSNTIMRALKSFANGADVMVEINKVILNPLFMTCFIVSGIGSAYLMVMAGGAIAVSGGFFFVGTTLVTVIKNVPLNNKLLNSESTSQRAEVWTEYLKKWVFWNHIRSVAGVTSGFLLVL